MWIHVLHLPLFLMLFHWHRGNSITISILPYIFKMSSGKCRQVYLGFNVLNKNCNKIIKSKNNKVWSKSSSFPRWSWSRYTSFKSDATSSIRSLPAGARITVQWRHNERDGVSNHQPHDCLFNRLFRQRSKKTSKLRVTGLCAGNSPVTGEFPAQRASNAENVFIW